MSQNDSSNMWTPDQHVLRLLADAIQEHLPSDAIDETKIREIVATEIAEANLFQSIEVRLPEGKSNTTDGTFYIENK